MRTALFPGSFDPFTAGHEAIVRRALALFDTIYIAVGVNTDKKYMFSIEERLKIIRDFFPDDKRIEPVSYSGMTVDLCHQLNTRFIIRGIRNAADLDYDQTLDPQIETILLLADNQHRDISSTLIREQLSHQSK